MDASLWLYAWLILALWQLILFFYQYFRRDAGIVDVGWTIGLAFSAAWIAYHGSGNTDRRVLLVFLTGFWAIRLSLHLFFNRVWKGPEDGRYAMLRESWGSKANLKFFIFFQIQALWSLLFAIPFVFVVNNNQPLNLITDILAVCLWIIAIAGEATADFQLEKWRRNNPGKTCRAGFWRFSRHPNYFFEWLHWWVYPLLAVGDSRWYIALSGPVLMSFFLNKLTGIPYTEKRAFASRGEDYYQYQQETSAFFPWFPTKDKGEIK